MTYFHIFTIARYETLISKDNLKSKILNFLEESDKICRLYPYIDVFLMVRLKVSNDLQKYFQDVLDSFKDLISEVQEAIDRKEVNYPDSQVFLSDLFSLSSFSYIFSNFFRSLGLPVHRKSIFDDCKNKNERILDILFGRN